MGVYASVGAGVVEGFAMEGGCDVVAELANVAGLHAPVLAGYDGGGYLSAGKSADGCVLGFGASGRVLGEGDDGVGGVKAYSDEVDLRGGGHLGMVNRWGGVGEFDDYAGLVGGYD